ncbi:hypothetical protein NLU66_15900 [Brachybacterium sp. NBEC-018]|uniref:Uncharacterized protein n=1 Tax=Brachybacterium rhamnosum TaxID=173361 RepID=A0ABW4PT68_9MICO|nr:MULTISPECIES: hypothetical protein [unclassified Brachybacterium]QCR54684.1 hypothetical protein C1N80_14595 [Brachybacterium sp. SGAir0954]UVY83677.1 hypothetical protein NLU66_15900 [Brachybacterium sp. NBEC-018]
MAGGPRVDEESLPTRTFSPPAIVIGAALLAGVVFGVVLEFLVIVSLIGQRLWHDPALGHDLLFTLPLLLWVAVLAATVLGVVRVVSSWLEVDEHGFRLHGLVRRDSAAGWDEVAKVLAIREIDRGLTPVELLDVPETAYDGIYLLDAQGRRMLAVSSRMFGHRAQRITLERARAAGVEVEDIEVLAFTELRARAPQALTVLDRHPNLCLALLALFYVGHNVLTFVVWGL